MKIICSKCGIDKDVSEFNKRTDRKRGYSSRCKSCMKEAKKHHTKHDVYVSCDNCGKSFSISPSSLCRHKKHGKNKYCSRECSHLHRGQNYGGYLSKCKTCGKEFVASYEKSYCSQSCYMDDPETFSRLLRMNEIKSKNGRKETECANCGKELYLKKSNICERNYCDVYCKREYFKARFDRFIASNTSIKEFNNYDEFLCKEVLLCPVDGCNWSGKFLSAHANIAHGIKSDEFKIMCGFNLTTPLVTRELHDKMKNTDREYLSIFRTEDQMINWYSSERKHKGYTSKESMEHRKKAFAIRKLNKMVPPPEK